MLLPTPLLWLFGADAGMLSIGVPALRLLALSYLPARAWVLHSDPVPGGGGRGRSSLVIFLLRQFLITLPLAWLQAGPLGLPGIWLSFLAAETVAALAAVGMLLRLLHTDPILRAEKSE